MKLMKNKREIFLLIALVVILTLSVSQIYKSSKLNRTLALENKNLSSQLDMLEEKNIELEKEIDANGISTDREPPKINNLSITDLNGLNVMDGGWAKVPENGKVKVQLDIKGACTQLDLFYTPTGTETYILQRMIDTVSVLPGEEKVTYVWEVPKGTMGHIWALAYNVDVARASIMMNVYYE